MHKQHNQQPNQHGSKPDKAQLSVLHFNHALKCLLPGLGRHQWQHPFNHQHKTESKQQCRVQDSVISNYLLGVARPEFRMYLKKSEPGSKTKTSLLLLKLLR